MTRLHSLSDLSSLFGGPGAQTPATKMGGSAEAGRPGDVDMETVAYSETRTNEKVSPAEAFDDRRPPLIDRAERWISSCVARSQDEPVTETVTLTPSLAQALLNRNPNNRKISASVVDKYARDIATGRFTYNGESIIVSREGMMNDGQHRCAAVVKCGKTLRTVIVFGPDRESRMTLGQGKIRLVSDHIAMQGLPDSASYGAVSAYIWQYKTHKRLSSQGYLRPTKAEILATIQSYPDIADSMGKTVRQGANLLGGRSLLAFAHWVFSRRDREAADAFMRDLGTGAGLTAGNPILYARNRLMSGARLTPNEKAELLIRAWNACRRKENRVTLQIKGGQLPPIED